jgi:hypothetical protein
MLVFNWFSFTTRLVIEFTSNVSTSASAHTAGLFATTPLSALSGSTGGVGWLVLNYYLCVEKQSPSAEDLFPIPEMEGFVFVQGVMSKLTRQTKSR